VFRRKGKWVGRKAECENVSVTGRGGVGGGGVNMNNRLFIFYDTLEGPRARMFQ
jgi:hypothetical protein